MLTIVGKSPCLFKYRETGSSGNFIRFNKLLRSFLVLYVSRIRIESD